RRTGDRHRPTSRLGVPRPLLQRHVPFPDIYGCYCRNLGRRGSGRAGSLLAAAADRADSAAERRLIALLRGAGISG
ncbi:MAG TPA: hypothetical protein VGE11_18780, partial [Pseudonocardia sp.]